MFSQLNTACLQKHTETGGRACTYSQMHLCNRSNALINFQSCSCTDSHRHSLNQTHQTSQWPLGKKEQLRLNTVTCYLRLHDPPVYSTPGCGTTKPPINPHTHQPRIHPDIHTHTHTHHHPPASPSHIPPYHAQIMKPIHCYIS